GYCWGCEEYEIDSWKRCKSESGTEWQEWQNNPQGDNTQSGGCERPAGTAAEGVPAGPDHKQHQCLCGQGLDKPARVELGFLRMQQSQQHIKSKKIVDGTNRSNKQHEVANQFDVPVLRRTDVSGINVIGWNGDLGHIIKKI